MAHSGKSKTCTLVCWVIAVVVGLIVLKLTAGGMTYVLPLFFGLIAALIVGVLLSRMMCKSASAGADTSEKSPTQAMAEREALEKSRAERAAAAEAEKQAAAAKAAAAAEEAALKAAEEAAAVQAAEEAAAKAAEAEAATSAAAGDVERDDDKAALAEEEAAPAVVIKSAQLPGQDDLAARKGAWKYEGEAADDAGEPKAEKAEAAPEAADVAGEAAQPVGLAAARDGGADDLKQIKGVGPKMEQLLNSLGFFHFDQIAGWGAADVAWMDDNLKGFKGRVTRDSWVDQSKTLAGGGETEFSKRVEDGGVY